MPELTRDEMLARIASGEAVIVCGKMVTAPANLPGEDAITAHRNGHAANAAPNREVRDGLPVAYRLEL